jgi:hypothetical protein
MKIPYRIRHIFLARRWTNCIELNPPWETNSRSTSQKIPRISWNLRVHYRVHKRPELLPILSQMNPVHTLPICFSKIHSDYTLPSTPRSSEWSLPFRFTDQLNVANYTRLIYLSVIQCSSNKTPASFWSSSYRTLKVLAVGEVLYGFPIIRDLNL